MKVKEEQARSLFGIALTSRPRWQQFVICSSGFFFGYLVNGICEEYVYNRLQFSYGWYFTFVQGWVYLALMHLQGFTAKQMVNPWNTYVKLSGVLMGSQGLTKGALAFLNYPAQIMFKSTKVLPVMIMGAFIPGLRRKYPLDEYVSAVLLVIGLILFTLADAKTSPNFSVIGVIMVSGALVMDAFVGNFQEAIFKVNPQTTQTEMLFLLNGCWFAVLDSTNGFNRRSICRMDSMLGASLCLWCSSHGSNGHLRRPSLCSFANCFLWRCNNSHGDYSKKGSDFVAVIFDIHKASNITTLSWSAFDIFWNKFENDA